MLRPVIWWMMAFVLGELAKYGQVWLSVLCFVLFGIISIIGYVLNCLVTAEKEISEITDNATNAQDKIWRGIWKNRKSRRAFVCMAVSVLLFWCGNSQMKEFRQKEQIAESLQENMVWTFRGMIDRMEEKSSCYYVYLKHADIYMDAENADDKEPVSDTYIGEYSICLITEELPAQTGDWVYGTAKHQLWNQARNEGNYDEKSYYHSLGVMLKGNIKEISVWIDDTNEWSVSGKNASQQNGNQKNISQQNICEQIEGTEITKGEEMYGKLCGRLAELKEKLCSDIRGMCDEETAGIYEAILFGSKDNLLVETKEIYQNSGLAHVICISGIHLSVLGNGIYKLLRKRFGFVTSGSVCAISMWLYTIMTGMQPSALRALIMFIIRLGADMLGRKYQVTNAISLAVMILLWMNPGFLWNAGFYLSVLSVFSITCLSDMWNRFLHIQSKAGQTVHSSVLLTFVQLPVIAWNFYCVPVYGILLNLLVVPCMGMVVGCGVLGVVMGQLAEGAGKFGIGLGVYLLEIFEILSQWTGKLPLSGWICGKPQFVCVISYYVLGIVLFGGMSLYEKWNIYKRRWNTISEGWDSAGKDKAYRVAGAGECEKKVYEKRASEKRVCEKKASERKVSEKRASEKRASEKRVCEKKAYEEKVYEKQKADLEDEVDEEVAWYIRYSKRLAGVVCAVIFICILFYKDTPEFEVVCLDVGQGDGIYIQVEGKHLMIDGGSSDVKQVGKYRILPFLKAKGVASLDGILISHMDEDHISGVLELLQMCADGEYDVKTLYLTGHETLSEEYGEILELARKAEVNVQYVQKGSLFQGEEFVLHCLYPASNQVGEDRNALSQVWRLEYGGFSMMLTGDLDDNGEKKLMEEGGFWMLMC